MHSQRVLRRYLEEYFKSPVRKTVNNHWFSPWIDDDVDAVLRVEVPTNLALQRELYYTRLISYLLERESNRTTAPCSIGLFSDPRSSRKTFAVYKTLVGAVVGSLAVVKRFVEDADSPNGWPILEYIMEVPPDQDQCDYWDPVRTAAAADHLDILEYLLSRLTVLKESIPAIWNEAGMSRRMHAALGVASERGHSKAVHTVYKFAKKHDLAHTKSWGPGTPPGQDDFLLETAAASGCINTMRVALHICGKEVYGDLVMQSICKHNSIQLVRPLLKKQMWSFADARACFKVVVRYHCRDLVELLLDFGVDVSGIYCGWQSMYDAVKRYNTPVVKLLIQHGALAQPRVLSHCETKLKDHKYVCLRDFKGTDDEIIVSYMVAKHGSVKDLGIYEVLERLVEDVDDSKLWTAKVEMTMRDRWAIPGSKLIGHHLLAEGF
jgi:hypothetical protein